MECYASGSSSRPAFGDLWPGKVGHWEIPIPLRDKHALLR